MAMLNLSLPLYNVYTRIRNYSGYSVWIIYDHIYYCIIALSGCLLRSSVDSVSNKLNIHSLVYFRGRIIVI